MSTARDFLAAVQQRADLASGGYSWPRRAGKTAAMEVLADNARMRAALTAALDLSDESRRTGRRLSALVVDEAITAALTPKENDS